MQRHKYRTEVWFFLNAFGYIFGQEKEMCILNKSFAIWRIKPNQWHQFIAMRYKPVYAIELQYGRKVTETDIERK